VGRLPQSQAGNLTKNGVILTTLLQLQQNQKTSICQKIVVIPLFTNRIE